MRRCPAALALNDPSSTPLLPPHPNPASPPMQTKALIDTVLPFDATTFNIAKLRSGAA